MKKTTISVTFDDDWSGVTFPNLASEAPTLIGSGIQTDLTYLGESNAETSAERGRECIEQVLSSFNLVADSITPLRGSLDTYEVAVNINTSTETFVA